MKDNTAEDLERVGALYPGAIFAVMWAEARILESWWEGARQHLANGGSVEDVILAAGECLINSAKLATASPTADREIMQCYVDSADQMMSDDWRRYVMGKLGMM